MTSDALLRTPRVRLLPIKFYSITTNHYTENYTEKMAAATTESDALRAAGNKWCAMREYAQSKCVALRSLHSDRMILDQVLRIKKHNSAVIVLGKNILLG